MNSRRTAGGIPEPRSKMTQAEKAVAKAAAKAAAALRFLPDAEMLFAEMSS